jgi:CheY-like chemotaxis protein
MIRAVRDLLPFPRSFMANPLAFGAPFPGISVLIIDPNKDDRRYYAGGLRSSSTDYLVLEAGNGSSGLDLYRTTHRIDCVVLELFLPDVEALEVLASIVLNAYRPTVAVVGLARWASRTLSDIAVQKGLQACLMKSETPPDVLDREIQKAMRTVFSHRTKQSSDYLPLN